MAVDEQAFRKQLLKKYKIKFSCNGFDGRALGVTVALAPKPILQTQNCIPCVLYLHSIMKTW